LPEWIKSYYANYLGGHVEYPKSRRCGINLKEDRLELYFEQKSYGDKFEKKPTLIISYQSITNIENMDEKRISALRVVALGLIFVPLAIVGALWKKKHVYTVIQYKDEISERTIVLDFGKKIDEAQPLIYHKMLESKKDKS